MKISVIKGAIIVAVTAVGMTARLEAQDAPARRIVISLEDRKLALIEGDQVKKIYIVAVGKPSTPSPQGTFTIQRRVINPTYHHNGITVLPGPANPVGSRWMGLSVAGYGIHGTNAPKSIGKAASHGCIRMAKTDLEEFFEMVAVGDQVEILGQRNEETARLFEEAPAVPGKLAEQLAKANPAANAPSSAPELVTVAPTPTAAGSR